MPMHTPHTPSKTSLPHRLAQHASAIWSQKPLRWLALATLPLVAAVSFLAVGGSTAPTDIAKVTLPSEPLFAAAANDKPTLALALSVEYPTVGAQYVWDSTTSTGSNSRDDAYTNSKTNMSQLFGRSTIVDGKKTITNAVIGLVIVLLAVAIINTIASIL